MSNYRDDTQETAVASSDTWVGLRTITESTAKITSTLLFGLMVMHHDQATASDEVFDRAAHVVTETAVVSGEFSGSLAASVRVDERARITEKWSSRLRVLHSDEALISDTLIEGIRQAITESALVTDEVIDKRSTRSVITETATVTDFSGLYALDLMDESAVISDSVIGSLIARDLLNDTATVTNEVIDDHRARPPVVVEKARAESETFDTLRATDLIVDTAVVEGSVPGSLAGKGQAWTANVDTWAMSRYAPYGFSRLVVIDGVAYGEAEDGVYALDGGPEKIVSQLVTGKLDLGKGQLVHPTTAYTEYQLTGTAEMDVTTTQSGDPKTYTYVLPIEPAGHLTNGRFVFGRGLRGRHFSFALRMTGEQGGINDLSVNVAQTKRRV